eukprot:scaffold271468_cov32-Tisochrysis_lutea.AAC.3
MPIAPIHGGRAAKHPALVIHAACTHLDCSGVPHDDILTRHCLILPKGDVVHAIRFPTQDEIE